MPFFNDPQEHNDNRPISGPLAVVGRQTTVLQGASVRFSTEKEKMDSENWLPREKKNINQVFNIWWDLLRRFRNAHKRS